MTTLTDTQVITASGGLVELGYNSRTTGISIDGTSWGSATIINPNTAVVCDGSPVVVEFSCGQVEISSGSQVQFALFRDGSAIAYNLAWYTNSGSSSNEYQPVSFFFRDTPTAGSHTYSVRAIKPPGTFVYLYASNGSSQSDGGPATMRVSKIVQATQWPAVTTGTIICTSSTRPASPFEGQRIYQTDDKRELVYNGSAWVTTTPVGASIPDSGTRGSTSYGALTGGGTNPSVTVQTGTSALVTLGSWCQVGSNVAAYVSFKVSGATTRASSDNDMIALYQFNTSNVEAAVSRTVLVTGLTAGINTFELEYRGNVSSTLTYQRRSIVVQGIP